MLADHLKLLGQRQVTLSLTVQQRAGASCSHRFPLPTSPMGNIPTECCCTVSFVQLRSPDIQKPPVFLRDFWQISLAFVPETEFFLSQSGNKSCPVSKRWWYCCSKTIIQTFLKIESGIKPPNISIRYKDCKWFMENSLLTDSVSNCPGIWMTEKLILPC